MRQYRRVVLIVILLFIIVIIRRLKKIEFAELDPIVSTPTNPDAFFDKDGNFKERNLAKYGKTFMRQVIKKIICGFPGQQYNPALWKYCGNDLWGDLLKVFTDLGGDIADLANATWDGTLKAAGAVGEGVTSAVNAVGDAAGVVGQGATAAADAVGDAAGVVGQGATAAVEAVEDIVTNPGAAAAAAATAAEQGVTAAGNTLGNIATDPVGSFNNAGALMKSLGNAAKSLLTSSKCEAYAMFPLFEDPEILKRFMKYQKLMPNDVKFALGDREGIWTGDKIYNVSDLVRNSSAVLFTSDRMELNGRKKKYKRIRTGFKKIKIRDGCQDDWDDDHRVLVLKAGKNKTYTDLKNRTWGFVVVPYGITLKYNGKEYSNIAGPTGGWGPGGTITVTDHFTAGNSTHLEAIPTKVYDNEYEARYECYINSKAVGYGVHQIREGWFNITQKYHLLKFSYNKVLKSGYVKIVEKVGIKQKAVNIYKKEYDRIIAEQKKKADEDAAERARQARENKWRGSATFEYGLTLPLSNFHWEGWNKTYKECKELAEKKGHIAWGMQSKHHPDAVSRGLESAACWSISEVHNFNGSGAPTDPHVGGCTDGGKSISTGCMSKHMFLQAEENRAAARRAAAQAKARAADFAKRIAGMNAQLAAIRNRPKKIYYGR